jgi:hypothetical protein
MSEEGMCRGGNAEQAQNGCGKQPTYGVSHGSIPDQRLSDTLGKDVIKIEMDLRDDADIPAGGTGRRDDGFDPQLDLLARPYDARVDRAYGLLAETARGRGREIELDHGSKPIGPLGQAKIANLRAQIQHAVFDREPVFDGVDGPD